MIVMFYRGEARDRRRDKSRTSGCENQWLSIHDPKHDLFKGRIWDSGFANVLQHHEQQTDHHWNPEEGHGEEGISDKEIGGGIALYFVGIFISISFIY